MKILKVKQLIKPERLNGKKQCNKYNQKYYEKKQDEILKKRMLKKFCRNELNNYNNLFD